MKRIPPLHLLVAFEAVSRLGSVTKAAEALSLTASAVSHRISKLEEMLNIELCERTRDGMRLTRPGETYANALRGVLEQMIGLSDCLSPEVEDYGLCIHTEPGFGRLWLLPRLAEFKRFCPDVHLEISAAYEPGGFFNDPADLWIYRNHVESDSLWAQRLFVEQFVPLASPDFLKKHPIKDFSGLLEVPLIYCRRNSPNWEDWFKKFGLRAPHLDWDLAVSNPGYAVQTASHGLGVVLESLQLSERYRNDGRLVEVFSQDAAIAGPGHFFVCPHSHLERSAVQCFLAWLRSVCG